MAAALYIYEHISLLREIFGLLVLDLSSARSTRLNLTSDRYRFPRVFGRHYADGVVSGGYR